MRSATARFAPGRMDFIFDVEPDATSSVPVVAYSSNAEFAKKSKAKQAEVKKGCVHVPVSQQLLKLLGDVVENRKARKEARKADKKESAYEVKGDKSVVVKRQKPADDDDIF